MTTAVIFLIFIVVSIVVCAIVRNEEKIDAILAMSQYVDREVDTIDGL